jgi:hypothetical protein
MRWGSRYCLDGEKRSELSVSGFRRNPYLTPRWSKTAEETYGRGPAMSVLPDIKMVNRMSKDQAQAGAMKTRPPVNVWDASVKRKQLNLDPGGINTLNSTARFPPTFMQTGADPAAAQAMIEHTEAKIEKAFYLDMLELPLVRRSHSAMTAEEIMARRQQAFARAAPITGRLQGEWCQPAVERTVMWQLETGKLLPVPASLRGRSIKPVFTSPLAQSQRQRESDNLVETIQQALPVLGLDPGASMNIDADKALRAIWGNRNADPRILRRPRVVAGMKEREAEQQALAQGAATAKDLASAAKDASAAQLPAA